MLKTLAALGLTTALVFAPVAGFAQTTTPDTTAPAADAKPAPEAPMKKHTVKKHMAKKHKKAMKKEAAPAAEEAPKS